MPKTSRAVRTADEIAGMASRGEDVSAHFTKKFTVIRPIRRVNVNLTQGMLRELDERAARLNIRPPGRNQNPARKGVKRGVGVQIRVEEKGRLKRGSACGTGTLLPNERPAPYIG